VGGLSSGFGGSDDEDDCNAIAFGGSQLVRRQFETRTSADAPLSTGGIRYRATDPRHATAANGDSTAVTETHTAAERTQGKQKKEKRKKEKRKKEKKERKERKRDRKKERKEEKARKKRRRDSDDSDSSS